MPTLAEVKKSATPSVPEKNLQELRVLVLATTFPRWENDAEPRFVFDLTKHLAEKVSLWVLVPHAPGARMEEEIDGVRILRFPYFFPKRLQTLCYEGGILPKLKTKWLARLQLPFFLAAQGFHIWRTVRKYKINFIHCHWIIPQGFFVALIHLVYKIPYILTGLGADVYAFKNIPLIGTLRNFAIKNAWLCTANSKALVNSLKSISQKPKFKHIPNGVYEDLFHENNRDPQLKDNLGISGIFLLGVGRFADKKGFNYLIQAMPKILAAQPTAKLVLVGYGPNESALKQQVKNLRIENAVFFPGGKSGLELARYFATADIFIGPSIVVSGGDTEGQPAVFVEAMSAKTAVVASNVGGISDMIEDGVTGLLVAEKDSNAIAEKVITLCENPNLRKSLEENARQLVLEKYCWDNIASRFLDIYSTHKTDPNG
ncbi:MAG: glycosyltransferase family 4 protein [Nitrospinae bacterium]|nr:glycosyltransferase family 4 protein [Nitrospinota bacterium]